MKTLSPAKINLMLRILGQRTDGYHLLQTYFQLLDWGDEMVFSLSNTDEVNIIGNFNDLPVIDNLIFKATQLLLPFRNIKKGVTVKVDKKIPQGSGLGGGSSNAGTTLRALNQLWDCNLPEKKLLKLAIQLGADVPIFVSNKSAMATGIGEKIFPYSINSYYFVLIFPKTSISTSEVFSEKDLVRNQVPISIDEIGNKDQWTNACLPLVLQKFPEVKKMYNMASKHASIYMTGTGSTLFSCFENKAKAEQFIQQCPKHWYTAICQSRLNA